MALYWLGHRMFRLIENRKKWGNLLKQYQNRQHSITARADIFNTMVDIQRVLQNCPFYLFSVRREAGESWHYFRGRLDGFAHNEIQS